MQHMQNLIHVEPHKTNCKNASWYGFVSGPPNLSISTVLNGYGVATLEYGNCFTKGRVVVYLNDVEISSAGKNSEEKVEFAFHDQDVLKIVEENVAIIQYNDFYVVNCMI